MRSLLVAAACLLPTGAALAQVSEEPAYSAQILGTGEADHGRIMVQTTASGTQLVTLELTDLPEGGHGVHLHETGDCSAEDFSSAGGHIAGEMEHGVMARGGPHPGDLPNVRADAEGAVSQEHFLSISPEMLDDEDGAAVIVHSGADDYSSQPSGDAGDRIACGVLEAD